MIMVSKVGKKAAVKGTSAAGRKGISSGGKNEKPTLKVPVNKPESKSEGLKNQNGGRFSRCTLFLLRIVIGFTFLWPFFDKTFGLGFSTKPGAAWIAGGSPTTGFLLHGTHGPFAAVFQALAGNPAVDWVFMLGLLGIGLAMIIGVATRFAAWSGTTMVLLMWLSEFPPETNPLIDYHIVYALALLTIMITGAQYIWGLGRWWESLAIVRKYPFLK